MPTYATPREIPAAPTARLVSLTAIRGRNIIGPRNGDRRIGSTAPKRDFRTRYPVAKEENMVRKSTQTLAFAFCLTCALCVGGPADETATKDSGALDGLWSGSWGLLVDSDGTVHQPVKAELFIQGDHVEWDGFPEVQNLTGTIRVDASAGQLRVTPAAKAGEPTADAMVYAYKINGDALELTDASQRTIVFSPVRWNPLADVKVEFLAALGMNEAGDLLVTDYEVHRAGRPAKPSLALARRTQGVKQAAIFLAQENGLKKTNSEEVRRRIQGPTPVVVAYRASDRPAASLRERWQATDSEEVARTIAAALRPGTLVFVMPESAKAVPLP